MKKFFALCSMVVALGFVATGCGGGNDPAPTQPTPAVYNGDAVEDNVPAEETVPVVDGDE